MENSFIIDGWSSVKTIHHQNKQEVDAILFDSAKSIRKTGIFTCNNYQSELCF